MAVKTKKRRKLKLKNIVLFFVVAAFVVYAVVSLSVAYARISEKKNDIAQVQAEVAEEENKSKEYDYLLKDKNYKEYVESAARDSGYVEPDERVFVDIAGK